MNPTPLLKKTPPVDHHRPGKRTYRRRTVSSSKAPSVVRRHGRDARNQTSTDDDIIVRLPIKSIVPLSWILSSATQILVDHLLFSRGVIPLSVPQLRDNKQGEVLKSRSQRRKVAQCRTRLESWHLEWSQIDRRILENCSCILISLGPSFLRSKEFYILNVAEERKILERHPALKLPPVHALARRLLPRIVESDTDLPCRSAPSFQISVSLFVKAEALERASNDESIEMSNLFIRRPGYMLPTATTTKANQRVTYINILNADRNDETEVKISESIGVADGAHWVSLRSSIKGFRLSG
ncbi:unnamed protein product [Cylindrotheca closterium]|uniref:Uncharacterized protein n=1 Tax=Cylindrotheca closterium TaxID=2856 RepID=A0AAD2FX90_9STRA|nr:unnamed protein product [Cylindrotheca closterium]